MNKPMTLNVRISGALSEFVAANVGEDRAYESISDYIEDVIRRDKERVEREGFERLKAELQAAFAQSDDDGRIVTLEDVITRNRARFEAE
ncbi:addiction module antitoxin [Sphingomonas crocodyli]|uniref:Addiction module antitoxin n=2 Tax=Sphingomonas crocodyli TaxID=1979270 RepID=A0A437LV46_9SPHN|nr:addiction module antitoxin [Sphingomonas crocodyli]